MDDNCHGAFNKSWTFLFSSEQHSLVIIATGHRQGGCWLALEWGQWAWQKCSSTKVYLYLCSSTQALLTGTSTRSAPAHKHCWLVQVLEVLQSTSTTGCWYKYYKYSSAGWYSVAPLSRGCQKREGGRHLPNNGLTSFLAGERGAGGHVVISKRQRGERGGQRKERFRRFFL